MNAQELCSVLQNTYNADANERKNAEKILKQATLQPGFVNALIELLSTQANQSNLHVLQAGALQLKNVARKKWCPIFKVNENKGRYLNYLYFIFLY